MGKVRIIGGQLKSRLIIVSDEFTTLRPTLNRVRETLFNWLGHDLSNKICVDLFAGSGALGFEAISQYAKQVIFVEKIQKLVNVLNNNIRTLGINNAVVINQDALSYLENINFKVDILFLDPPFNTNLLNKSLTIIAQKATIFKDTIIYIEYTETINLDNFEIKKHKTAGKVKFAIITLNELI